MRFAQFLPLLFGLLSHAALASGGPWAVNYQNIKLPTQKVVEHARWWAPQGSSTNLLTGGPSSLGGTIALNNFLPTLVTSFAAQPDLARNIQISPWATTGGIGAGPVVISGTNIFGNPISETLTFVSQNGATVVGAKAFKTVTSVLFPATINSGANVAIGTGNSIGILHCVDQAGDLVQTVYGGAYETSRAVLNAGNSVAIESNTVQPHGTLDGAHQVDVYYFQNYRCFGNQ